MTAYFFFNILPPKFTNIHYRKCILVIAVIENSKYRLQDSLTVLSRYQSWIINSFPFIYSNFNRRQTVKFELITLCMSSHGNEYKVQHSAIIYIMLIITLMLILLHLPFSLLIMLINKRLINIRKSV